MRLKEMQYRLTQAIYRRKPYGDGLGVIGGEAAFAVYRNNVFVSLANSLRGLYPLTAAILDEGIGEGFQEKAVAFI